MITFALTLCAFLIGALTAVCVGLPFVLTELRRATRIIEQQKAEAAFWRFVAQQNGECAAHLARHLAEQQTPPDTDDADWWKK